MKTPNLLNVLELISQGETEITVKYPYNPEREVSLLSRLKFELYGEYPLSPDNESHFETYIAHRNITSLKHLLMKYLCL